MNEPSATHNQASPAADSGTAAAPVGIRPAHTPGPWTAATPTQANGRAEVYAGSVLVAQAFNWMQDSTGEDYCRADARLIAAAPRLAEALRDMLVVCQPKFKATITKACAALTAAGIST